MTNESERKRPIKQFRVIKAYGPYRVGDTLQPTGMYRQVLQARGLIEEIKEEPVKEALADRVVQPEFDRMIPARDTANAAALTTRGRRR